jgi:hypothetical protein
LLVLVGNCARLLFAKAAIKKGQRTGKGNTMSELGVGIGLLVAFLAVVVLIIRGQSPIIMLLLLAVLWSASQASASTISRKRFSRAAASPMRAP